MTMALLELGAASKRAGVPIKQLLLAIDAGELQAERLPDSRRIGITEDELDRYAAQANR